MATPCRMAMLQNQKKEKKTYNFMAWIKGLNQLKSAYRGKKPFVLNQSIGTYCGAIAPLHLHHPPFYHFL
jgi:hypothetical protein